MPAKDKKTIEQMIKEVQGTMAIEGMELTSDDVRLLTDCAEGRLSYEEAINQLVLLYSQPLCEEDK